MAQSRFDAFDNYLRSNGIPIDGLSGSQPYGPETVTINFLPSATAEQILWANDAKQTFDWRPRRFLTEQVIASTLAGLTVNQRNAILLRLAARAIVNDEPWVRQVMQDHQVAIPYDEVAP